MKLKISQELPSIILALLPLAYLLLIWNSLPESVPLHWNASGEIDRYGEKTELLFMTLFVPGIVYGIMSIIPSIDPKKKIEFMGKKYHQLKMLLVALMSVLTCYIIYSVENVTLANPNILFIVLGLLYLVLGNYFQSIKANYFVGIRTPWTLENETVWKETHRFGGKIWMIGGIVIIVSSFILSKNIISPIFISVTAIIVIVPIVHSYLRFKALERNKQIEN